MFVAASIGLVAWLMPRDDPRRQHTGTRSTALPAIESPSLCAAPQFRTTAIGELAIVADNKGGGRTPIFEDRTVYDESIKLAVAGDRAGFAALMIASMPCTPRTRVRILDTTWTGSYRVGILDGPFAGRSGWVAKEDIALE